MRSWRERLLWASLFCLFQWTGFAQGGDPARLVQLEPNFEMLLLDPYLDYLEDVEGKLTIEQILGPAQQSRFQRHEQGIFSKGYSTSVYWFRTRLFNVGEQSQHLWLLRERESIQIKAWTIQPDGEPSLFWDKGWLPPSPNLSRAQRLGAGLELPAGNETELYLSLRVNTDLKALLTLWSPEVYAKQELAETRLFSASWGMSFLFFLLALIVFISSRKWIYLYYALFLLCFLCIRILRIDLNGALTEWVGSWGYWLVALLIWGAGLFVILFSKELLKLESMRRSLVKVLTIGLLFVGPLVLLLGNDRLALLVMTMVSAMLLPFPWYWGIIAVRKGVQGANYYLMGLGSLLIPIGLVALMALGLVPFNNWVNPALELTALLESLFFALALSKRFGVLQQQVLRDQQLALTKMEESERLKEQFLMSTTHELKTPLQGIIGLSQEMLDQVKQQGLVPFVQPMEVIQHSAQRLHYMINNLLDLSSLAGAGIQLSTKPVDPKEIIETVTVLLRPRFKTRNTPLQQEFGKLPRVQADPTKLEQVLMNLLGNALKYAPGNAVLIVAKEIPGFVRFEIHDSGEGIAEELRSQIFLRFQRGRHRNIEGLGLGLSLCSEIVAKHQGEIGVEDSPLGGAKFWFTIPAIPTQHISTSLEFETSRRDLSLEAIPPTTSQVQPAQKAGEAENEITILIVDDDPDVIQVLLVLLQQSPWQVSYCSSGAEALELLSQDLSVDLVILDVMMPEMDGFEVCEVLRKQHSPQELPILFLTALARAEDIAQAFQVGGNDYLMKPIVKSELIQRITAQLELRVPRDRRSGGDLNADLSDEHQLLSNAMLESLACWQHCARKDQIALALESKIWGAYLDKSNGIWKAPGIRQYLNSASMPAHPRWRKVVQTAEFVLQQSAEDDPHREKLEALVSSIYQSYSAKQKKI